MRILSFDPGAKRCGFAVLEKKEKGEPEVLGFGFQGLKRKDGEKFQPYRLRLIDLWVQKASSLIEHHAPTKVVVETVPVMSGGNFANIAYSSLVATVATVIQTITIERKIPLEQVAANSVKRKIGGVKDATKPKVRDGVFELLPSFAARYKDSKTPLKEWDIYDALAIGLYELGYKR